MAWVQGLVTGRVEQDGRIIARTSQLKIMETSRPRENFADSGADPVVFEKLRRREPGEFQTLGYMGGATAILIRTSALELLPDLLMQKLATKYGEIGPLMYLAEVRNTGAPTIWNVAEPSGGMAESLNLPAEQMGETVELGVYRSDGWLRFVLPEDLEEYQLQLDREQSLAWSVVRPGFPCKYDARIRFLDIGTDELDGCPGILSAGPVGDFSHLAIAQLELPGGGWKMLDTECRPGKPENGEPEWVALNRKIVGITPREGKSPMMYEFSPEGGLDHCGLHIALSGEALPYNISHLSLAALGPRGLNWLREVP